MISLQEPGDAQAAAHDVKADGKMQVKVQEDADQTARRRSSKCKKKKKLKLQEEEEEAQTARRSRSDCKKNRSKFKNKEVRQQEEDWNATCIATDPHGVL